MRARAVRSRIILFSTLSSALMTVLTIAAPPQHPQPAPASKGENGTKLRRVIEAYPLRIQARQELRMRTLKNLTMPVNGLAPKFVINLTKRWPVGQTLKVAFRGGDDTLHQKIAETVNEWTNYANLKFDFGRDPVSGHFRTWSLSDTDFTADIRVSFDQAGYYSLVGNDSINRTISRPGEESLNLEGFDTQLPSDWKAVALHEFGHAIGFEHEHQSPIGDCDFRFDDDPGYVPTTDQFGQFIPDSRNRRPGLYTLLGGPPNNWPKAVVDFNLKQLPDSHAYEVGPFDKDSIMKYFFPAFMFIAGEQSHCYTPTENLVLSDGDKAGAEKVYPRAPEQEKVATELQSKALRAVSKVETMPAEAKRMIEKQLQHLRPR
jgi:hypothetical protein